jgi:hypothetical protein
MKKLFLLIAFAAFSYATSAQCTIDQNNTEFLSPRPDSLPCVERGVAYSEVLQFAIPASIDLSQFIGFPLTANIISVIIDTVQGLPTGMSYVSNPADGILLGGDNGCALLSGTTSDPAGTYPISFEGTITVNTFITGDTTFDIATLQSLGGGGGGGFFPGEIALEVIEQGGECRPATAGIKNFNAELQSAFLIFPNPSNGLVNINIRNQEFNKAEISVYDFTGKQVMTETFTTQGNLNKQLNLSALPKGVYAILLKTDKGTASKNIVLE